MQTHPESTAEPDAIHGPEEVSVKEASVPGEVAEIHFPNGNSLSLTACKLFVKLLDLAGDNVVEDRTHRATLGSLDWPHRERSKLEEAIEELHATTISLALYTPCGERRRSGGVLADADRPMDITQGEIHWRFSQTFRALARNSRHWSVFASRAVLAMECKYSPALYHLAAPHAGRDKVLEDWDLDDLRERLGATAKSLRRWQDFRRHVLEPACAEIDRTTEVGISWGPIMHGRRVMGVRLCTWRKGPGESDAATPKFRPQARGADIIGRIVEEGAAWRRAVEVRLARFTPEGEDT